MDDIQAKMKLWVDAIASERLEGLADQLEEVLGSLTTERSNKILFKLLLYLSHAANKCDKSNLKTGLEIGRFCCFLCSNMTVVPDSKKFFSCVYYTTSCLLAMGLYTEALEICDFVLPGKLWKNELSNCEDMYSQLSHLLHDAVLKLLKRSKLASRKQYEILVTMIKYELDLTKLGRRSYWRYVLSRILSYCEKVGAVAGISAQSTKEEFANAMLAYLSLEKISLDDENKEHTYRLILLIITEMIVRNINKEKISSNGHTLTRYFDAFRNCLVNHESYMRCFKLYERVATAFVRPIQNLTSSVIQEIDSCAAELRKLLISYGHGDAIKWYSYSSVLLLNEILGYWEESAKSNAAQFLTDSLIVTTMNFLDEQCGIFYCYEANTCRCSETNKCGVRYDVYNNVTLRLKALSVVSRVLSNNGSVATEEMCTVAVAFSEESNEGIVTIKEGGCGQWSSLWPACGAHMYNISVACESKHYEKSVQLYSLLCLSLVKLEGLKSASNTPTLLNLRNPLCTLLHRLTSVHLSNGKYEEAMIVCSLNGLLSSKIPQGSAKVSECKAYVSWTHIKNKHPPARKMTMLECLRFNEEEISKIIEIRWEDYDPIELCLREIRGLAYARVNLSSSIIEALDQMEQLGSSPARYAQGVQLLGYHLLHFQCEQSIGKYLRKAAISYECKPQPGTSFHWRYGHVKFYEFCQRLRDISIKTESEMKSAKFALTSSSTSSSYVDTGPSVSEVENIVPAYSTINIGVTREIASYLERALHAWKEAIGAHGNYRHFLEDWEVTHTLEVVMIAGEYARLYLLENLEVEAWKLAYKLARESGDNHAIIIVTTRSLSSKHVDRRWIEEADKAVKIMEQSDDPKTKETIGRYRLCLANLYHQNGCTELSEKLLLSTTFDGNIPLEAPNYLLSVHLKMSGCQLMDESDDQSQYTRTIVQSLYTVLSIDDSLEAPSLVDKWRQLYNYDLLFEFTNNLAIRMNSLLSFREISAHLMRRLSSAQKLGAALRVAECLKSLCYIDLSRCKLDDCEVKLQGLEHILGTEGFDLTMKSQLHVPTFSDRIFHSPTRNLVEAVRDIGQNDTSPVLRDKVFASPDFIRHGDICACFKCSNSRYQNLVFASTHLRAQLFSLRRNSAVALQHFEGALMIKKNILSRALLGDQRDDNQYTNNKRSVTLRSHHHLDVVEFVIFHLDYCRFLRWSMPKRNKGGIELALYALELCQKHNLENHPVYASTNQLLFQYRYEDAYGKDQFSKFTVPAVDEMDISYNTNEPAEGPIICMTPIREVLAQKAISVRRKKVQPFLKLEKVPIDLTEEEPPISTSPPASTRRIRRRKIAEAQQDSTDLANERETSVISRVKLQISDDDPGQSVGASKRSSKNIDNATAGAKTVNRLLVDEIDLESALENSEVESERPTRSSSRAKSISQRGSGSSRSNNNNSGSSCTSRRGSNSSINSNSSTSSIAEASAVPAIQIDEVTDLLGELTVTKTRSCSSLTSSRTFSNARNSANSKKINENVITVPYYDATSSEDEVAIENKRTSTRLRKKSQDLPPDRKNMYQNQSASNSEDDVLIIETRSRRRVASSSNMQSATAKEPAKSSRSRVASKKNT